MNNDADNLVALAKRDAEQSRARFMATFEEIRYRVSPRVIAVEAAENIFQRASDLAADTRNSIQRRPLVSAGGVAAFALAVGVRLWLANRKRHFDAT